MRAPTPVVCMRRPGIKLTAWDCHKCKNSGDNRPSTKLAEAFYKVRSTYQSSSLQAILKGSRGANINFAARDNSISSKDESMRGKGGQPGNRPDLFFDKNHDLIAHRTNNPYSKSLAVAAFWHTTCALHPGAAWRVVAARAFAKPGA